MIRRLSPVAALAAAVTLTAASCGGDEPANPSATESSSPEVSAPKPPRQQALEALEKYLEVRDDLWTNTSSYASEAEFRAHVREVVPTVATGEEAKDLREDMLPGYDAPAVVTGVFEHRLHGAKRVPGKSQFTIKDCEDHSGVKVTENGRSRTLYLGPNGRPLADRVLHEYTVTLVGTDWLVSDEDFLLGKRC